MEASLELLNLIDDHKELLKDEVYIKMMNLLKKKTLEDKNNEIYELTIFYPKYIIRQADDEDDDEEDVIKFCSDSEIVIEQKTCIIQSKLKNPPSDIANGKPHHFNLWGLYHMIEETHRLNSFSIFEQFEGTSSRITFKDKDGVFKYIEPIILINSCIVFAKKL